jgi:hypothetical protein
LAHLISLGFAVVAHLFGKERQLGAARWTALLFLSSEIL